MVLSHTQPLLSPCYSKISSLFNPTEFLRVGSRCPSEQNETTAKIAELSAVYFQKAWHISAISETPADEYLTFVLSGEQVSLYNWASFEGDSMAPVGLTA